MELHPHLPNQKRDGDYPTLREYYKQMGRTRRLSPRVQQAIDLYATGAVPTQKEAAAMMGVSPVHISNVINKGGGRERMDKMQTKIADAAVNTSALIQSLGVEAINKLASLMRTGGSEGIQLRAAIDLADRSPETSKTQKIQVDTFSIDGEDAKALAAAIAVGRVVKAEFAEVVQQDFVRGGEDADVDKLIGGSK